LIIVFVLSVGVQAQPAATDAIVPSPLKGIDVAFSTVAEGEKYPIEWGLDAAWISTENVRRGAAYIGRDKISLLRVSFQPTEALVGDTALTASQKQDLNKRLAIARLLRSPKLVINSDPKEGAVDPYFTSSGRANAARWAKLIDVSTRAYEDAGYKVVTVSPFNEPDYGWGQGRISDFRDICQQLRTDYADHFRDIRISAGNTLNCDEASKWYNYMKPYVDEGCTHQLAGDFDTYASFFSEVRADNNHATADELHNVMEAMVGVEYGMQTGIWWGFDGLARGEFCRASFGDRLAYAEDRDNWAAASVYRNTLDNRVEAFIGTSERQASPSSWRFVCTDRPVYFDGYGPTHEFCVDMPGGNGYQKGQTNAERVVNISWGEDVQPSPIDGTYMIVNRNSRMVMSLLNNSVASGTNVVQLSWSNRNTQHWNVRPVDSRIGGDFSYYTICAAQNDYPIDVWNWSLDSGGDVRLYNGSLGTNEQWYLQYAGEGYFYIRSRHSNLCLEVASGSKSSGGNIQQATLTGASYQQWKIIPITSRCELTPPAAPTGLTVIPQSASVLLRWNRNGENDIAGYNVLRADSATGEWNTIARKVTDTLFVDNTVSSSVSCLYKLRAVDQSDNLSPCSELVACPASDGSKGLVARYEFDESLRDTTVNGFRLALYGNEIFTKTERYVVSGSHSLRLDGNSYLQTSASLMSSPQLTFCCWIYWTGGSAGAGQRIFDFGADASNSLYLTPSDGSHMRFVISKGGEEQSLLAPKLSALKMKHVALTMGTDSVTLYIDGQRVAATADITLRPSDIPAVFGYVGRAQRGAQTLLKAYLDDMRIYNYALTASEVAAVMADIDTAITPPSQSPSVVTPLSNPDLWYDLQGRAHSKPSTGIFIRNGKTILIK